MTTTLRPTGPERREADGTRARTYTVCVNSRVVGGIELGTDRRYGSAVGRINALTIDEPDRRRGRGTVAALAAEEVLRTWGCTRIETVVPAGSPYGLRMAASLGYTERNRGMALPLDPVEAGARPPHTLPAGSVVRPLEEAEYGAWHARETESFIATLTSYGVPPDQARAHEDRVFRTVLPDGPATADAALLALDHDGTTVGHLWLRLTDPAWVFSVRVVEGSRGRGHGRTLMLAAENASRQAGARRLLLNVFARNTPALALYDSLGYRPTDLHFHKPLV